MASSCGLPRNVTFRSPGTSLDTRAHLFGVTLIREKKTKEESDAWPFANAMEKDTAPDHSLHCAALFSIARGSLAGRGRSQVTD